MNTNLIANESKYYVYLHKRKSDGSIFYVGKGSGPRAKVKSGRSKHWFNTVEKHGYIIDFAFEGLTAEDAKKKERELIKEYDVLKDRGYGFDNISINQDIIKDIVTFPWSGELYSDKIWKDKELLLSSIKQLMLKSFVQGTSFTKLSKELSDKTGVSYVNAERLVRTESNYFMTQASKRAYIDQEILSYEYYAIIDAVTSKQCRDLDGKIFPVSEATPGVNYPPMHPNCRSTTLPVVGNYEDYDFEFDKATTFKEFFEKYN
jgi:SPP1 gp7 family putative phage head morphogenesis protein